MSTNKKAAYDDIFFSTVLILLGTYASSINIAENDYLGLAGTIIVILLGIAWLYARIYQLKHWKDDKKLTDKR